MSADVLTLDRADADALLFVLDDADRLFLHPRGAALLALWQRLHLARCYLDGEQGFTGTPEERALTLTPDDALNVWLALDPEWLRAVRPTALRERVTAIVDRCRPSRRPALPTPTRAEPAPRTT